MHSLSRRSFLEGMGVAAAASGASTAGAATLARGAPPRPVAAPEALAAVRAYIIDKIEKGIVPSLVVQVTRHGRPIWAEAFGYADLEAKREATIDTVYKIASISKPFTVSGLMTLVDRGRVDFDAPANRYLPGAKLRAYIGSAEEMTLRRLAHHRAGLPIHEILFYDDARRLDPEETIRRYGFAAWRPGTRFEYSNLGTAILGFISAYVSGKSWIDFMRSSILSPLRLDHTFAELPPGREKKVVGAVGGNLAEQYDYDLAGRFVRTGAHLTSHPGASSMWSNVSDLTRFARMHLGGGALDGVRVLSPAAVRTMQDFVAPSRQPGVVYGNGWITHADLVRRNFNHSGGGPGMGVMLAAYPDEDLVSAVLTNYSGAMAPEVTRRIAQALFGTPAAAAPPAVPQETGAGPPLGGAWRGVIHHHMGNIPVALRIVGDKAAEIAFGRLPVAPLESVDIGPSRLFGVTRGTLFRQPGFHGESILEFNLRLEEGRLVGIADTYAKGYFEVAHWVDLERQS